MTQFDTADPAFRAALRARAIERLRERAIERLRERAIERTGAGGPPPFVADSPDVPPEPVPAWALEVPGPSAAPSVDPAPIATVTPNRTLSEYARIGTVGPSPRTHLPPGPGDVVGPTYTRPTPPLIIPGVPEAPLARGELPYQPPDLTPAPPAPRSIGGEFLAAAERGIGNMGRMVGLGPAGADTRPSAPPEGAGGLRRFAQGAANVAGETVPALAAGVAGSVLTGGVGIPAAIGAALPMAAQAGGAAYERTGSSDAAMASAAVAAALGPLQVGGVLGRVPGLSKAVGEAVTPKVAAYIARRGAEAGFNGAVNVAQAYIDEEIAQRIGGAEAMPVDAASAFVGGAAATAGLGGALDLAGAVANRGARVVEGPRARGAETAPPVGAEALTAGDQRPAQVADQAGVAGRGGDQVGVVPERDGGVDAVRPFERAADPLVRVAGADQVGGEVGQGLANPANLAAETVALRGVVRDAQRVGDGVPVVGGEQRGVSVRSQVPPPSAIETATPLPELTQGRDLADSSAGASPPVRPSSSTATSGVDEALAPSDPAAAAARTPPAETTRQTDAGIQQGSSPDPTAAAPARPLTGLDRIEAEATARLREWADKKRRLGAVAPDPRESIPEDLRALRDAAIVAGVRVARAGVKGTRAVTEAVRTAIREIAPGLDQSRTDAAARMASRIVRGSVGEDGAVDPAALERAIGSVLEQSGERPAKTMIRENTGQASNEAPTIRQADALAGGLRREQRVAGKAYREGAAGARQVERAKGQQRLTAQRDKIQKQALTAGLRREEKAAARAWREAVRVTKQQENVKSQAKLKNMIARIDSKQATKDGIRAEAVRLLEEGLPQSMRGKYLVAVRDATTLKKLSKLSDRMLRDLVRADGRKAVKASERVTRKDVASLEPEMKSEAEAALGAIQRLRKLLGPDTTGQTERMSTPELAAVRDELVSTVKALNGLLHEQKTMDKVRVRGELVEAAKIREQVIERVSGRDEIKTGDTPSAPEPGWMTQLLRRRTNWESLSQLVDGFKSGGPGMQLFREVLRGRRTSLALQHAYQDGLASIVKANGYESIAHFQMETSGTLGQKSQKTVQVRVGPHSRITLGQAMYLYASSTDAGFRARIEAGQRVQFRADSNAAPFKLTLADLDRVAAALPSNVRRLVDEAKALYDSTFFSKLSAVNKRLKGYHLDKVDGYFGIKLNRQFSEGRGTPDSWRRQVIRAMEAAGVMQERTGPSKTPMLIGDFGTDIVMRGRAAATIIGKAEPAKLLTRVFLHPDAMTAVSRRLGTSTIKRIERRISLFSGGEMFNEAADRPLRTLLGLWARGKTQLWAWTWARNAVSGSARILAEVGGGRVSTTVLRSILRPKATWSEFQDLMRLSPELRERWAGGAVGSFYDHGADHGAEARFKLAMGATFRELREMAKGATSKNAAQVRDAAQGLGRSWRSVLDSITIANYFDAVPAIAAYRVMLEKAPKNLSGDARKRWAARHATRAFERVSNTATIEYANDVQLDARDSLWMATLIPFTGDTAKAQNMIYEVVHKGGRRQARVYSAIALGAVMSGVVSSMREIVLGQDDETRVARAGAQRALQDVVGIVPVLGPVLSKLVPRVVQGGKGAPAPELEVPVIEAVNSLMEATMAFWDAYDRLGEKQRKGVMTAGEKFRKAVWRTGETVGGGIGLPVQYFREARRAIEGWFGEGGRSPGR